MFSRDKSDARLGGSSAPAAPKGGIPSIISSDLRVVGDLRSDGDLQIDGVIEGDVESHSLTVGINAKIKGSVSADDARICGTVARRWSSGAQNAADAIMLEPNCRQ